MPSQRVSRKDPATTTPMGARTIARRHAVTIQATTIPAPGLRKPPPHERGERRVHDQREDGKDDGHRRRELRVQEAGVELEDLERKEREPLGDDERDAERSE